MGWPIPSGPHPAGSAPRIAPHGDTRLTRSPGRCHPIHSGLMNPTVGGATPCRSTSSSRLTTSRMAHTASISRGISRSSCRSTLKCAHRDVQDQSVRPRNTCRRSPSSPPALPAGEALRNRRRRTEHRSSPPWHDGITVATFSIGFEPRPGRHRDGASCRLGK